MNTIGNGFAKAMRSRTPEAPSCPRTMLTAAGAVNSGDAALAAPRSEPLIARQRIDCGTTRWSRDTLTAG
ncbi:MAG: hypothetical protein RMM98_17855 [Acidobacteriota bacterium]|nr:hypothetical protein [Acidobacteriota bacterium]